MVSDSFIETSAHGRMLQWKRHPFTTLAAQVSFGDLEPRFVDYAESRERHALAVENEPARFGWSWGTWTHVEARSSRGKLDHWSNPSERSKNTIYLPWSDFGNEVQLTASGDATSAAALLIRPDPPNPKIEVTHVGTQFEIVARRAAGAEFAATAFHVASPLGATFAVSNTPQPHHETKDARHWKLTAADSAFVLIVRPIAGGEVRVLACGYFRDGNLVWGSDTRSDQSLKALAIAAQRELSRGAQRRPWTAFWPKRSNERLAHVMRSLSSSFGTVIVGDGSEAWVCERITGLFRLYLLSGLHADISDAVKALDALNVLDWIDALQRAFPAAKEFVAHHSDADELLFAARNHRHPEFQWVAGAPAHSPVKALDRELQVAARLKRARTVLDRLRPDVPEVAAVARIIDSLRKYINGAELTPAWFVDLSQIEGRITAEESLPPVHPDENPPMTKARHAAWLERQRLRADWRRKLSAVLTFCETGKEETRSVDEQTLRSMLEALAVPEVRNPDPGGGTKLRAAAEELLATIGDETNKDLLDVAQKYLPAKLRDVADRWTNAHAVLARATALRPQYPWLSAQIHWTTGDLAARCREATRFLTLAAAVDDRVRLRAADIPPQWLDTPNAEGSEVIWQQCATLAEELCGVTCVAPLAAPPKRRLYDDMEVDEGLHSWWEDLAVAAATREQLRAARAAALAALEPFLMRLREPAIVAMRTSGDPSPRQYLDLFVSLAARPRGFIP